MKSTTKLTLLLMALPLGCGSQVGSSLGTNAVANGDPNSTGTQDPKKDGSDASDGKSDSSDTGQPVMPIPTATSDSGTPEPPKGDAGTATAPVPCLSSATMAPGTTMNVMLGTRQYLLHIGRAVTVGQAAPLVFSLHGLTMTPASMESMARWDPLSDTEGFIVAGPAGIGTANAWDLSGTKDFDLMKAVVEDVNAKACVDRKRIYSTGFSHGAFMTFANACKLSTLFAAVAPHSGAGTCQDASVRAMPIFTWHGDADQTVSYSSGKMSHDSWVMHDKCGAPTDFMIGTNKCQEWKGCTDNVPVKMCTIPGGGHMWSPDATKAIWEFFKPITMP